MRGLVEPLPRVQPYKQPAPVADAPTSATVVLKRVPTDVTFAQVRGVCGVPLHPDTRARFLNHPHCDPEPFPITPAPPATACLPSPRQLPRPHPSHENRLQVQSCLSSIPFLPCEVRPRCNADGAFSGLIVLEYPSLDLLPLVLSMLPPHAERVLGAGVKVEPFRLMPPTAPSNNKPGASDGGRKDRDAVGKMGELDSSAFRTWLGGSPSAIAPVATTTAGPRRQRGYSIGGYETAAVSGRGRARAGNVIRWRFSFFTRACDCSTALCRGWHTSPLCCGCHLLQVCVLRTHVRCRLCDVSRGLCSRVCVHPLCVLRDGLPCLAAVTQTSQPAGKGRSASDQFAPAPDTSKFVFRAYKGLRAAGASPAAAATAVTASPSGSSPVAVAHLPSFTTPVGARRASFGSSLSLSGGISGSECARFARGPDGSRGFSLARHRPVATTA